MLALLPSCLSFVTISQALYGADLANIRALAHGNFSAPATATLGFLWTFPEQSTDDRGLGGGIAWAWDDALCGAIEPLLKEDLFFFPLVECKDIKAAMHRALDSWAANHRFISFIDVSDDCRARHGVVNETCELIELWVTARDPADPGLTNEAARAWPNALTTQSFRYTNGATPQLWDAEAGRLVPRQVVETRGGTIAFTGHRVGQDSICWYLDSTFCAPFHTLKTLPGLTPNAVKTYGLALVVAITGFTLVVTLCQLLALCKEVVRPDAPSTVASNTSRRRLSAKDIRPGSCADRCAALADALARWSVCCTAVRFVLFVTPWLFYNQIFLPCFSCYDFEASAMHEIGHILGLSHPDMAAASTSYVSGCTAATCGPGNAHNLRRAPGLSWSQTAALDCSYPFDSIELTEEVRPSAMISFTQHNPRPCLELDDLEALHALYPDCGHRAAHVVCIKTQHNIGFVRLGVYFLCPVLAALLAAVIIGFITQRHQLRRMRSASKMLRTASIHVKTARRHESQAVEKAAKATVAAERLQVQLAVTESRVQDQIDAEVLRAVQQCTANQADAPAPCGADLTLPHLESSGTHASAADDARFGRAPSRMSANPPPRQSWMERASGLLQRASTRSSSMQNVLGAHATRPSRNDSLPSALGSERSEESSVNEASEVHSTAPRRGLVAYSMRRAAHAALRPSSRPPVRGSARGSSPLSRSPNGSYENSPRSNAPTAAGMGRATGGGGVSACSSGSAHSVSFDSFEPEVQVLVQMGFGNVQARVALQSTAGHLERAVDLLSSESPGAADAAAPASGRNRKSSIRSERV